MRNRYVCFGTVGKIKKMKLVIGLKRGANVKDGISLLIGYYL